MLTVELAITTDVGADVDAKEESVELEVNAVKTEVEALLVDDG